jgi:uncharacterized protein (TIGR03437 family)
MSRYRLSLVAAFILAALLVTPAFAQLQSQASLNGAYYVRYLGVNTDPADSPVSFSGTITFDGKGAFTVAGTGFSAATTDHSLKFATTGTYVVQSSGMYYMSNPFDPAPDANFPTTLYGGLSSGAVIASSTDSFYCDLFVAFPVATAASLATLSGNYQVASMEFLNGDFTQTRDTFFQLAPNGQGSLGNVTIKGTAINLRHAATTQTSTGATYTLAANGKGTLVLPAPSGLAAANTLISGTKTLYVSADGSLFIAGGDTAYDFVIGVKSAPGNTTLSGLYFQTYLENYAAGTQSDGIWSSSGSANVIGSLNLELVHQRTNPDGFANYDFNFADSIAFDADGTKTYSDAIFAIGAGGKLILGTGNGSNYQLMLYAKAPDMSGTGVFLNPQGMVNAATFTPFTAQVSPGEVLTLFGTGLASGITTVQGGTTFPTTLSGVQVLMNGAAIPIYSVSPTQLSVVIPFTSPQNGSLLTFQVNNNGTLSNEAKVYSGVTSPGLFTLDRSGIGGGAILHNATGLAVTTASPAVAGEFVQLYVSGLGRVNSTVAAGAPAPTAEPLARVTNALDVYIGGVAARVVYAGLAPGLGGLYQLSVQIPTGLSAGNQIIEISTVDADSLQATIPIA